MIMKNNLKIHNKTEKKTSIFKPPSIREKIAPDGINASLLDYFVINDGGKNVYVRNFYIDKLPREATFSVTFHKLLNFPNATSSIFIKPLVDGEAIKELDAQINSLGSEEDIALEKKDENRARKMRGKVTEAEEWAKSIDSGQNNMYHVGFLFSIYALSLEELEIKSGDFKSYASEKRIEISATYACHAEAYVENLPLNKLSTLIKYHTLDKHAVSTIYSHTNGELYHKNGIMLGVNLFSGKPIIYDLYDKSHNGYSIAVFGITHSGKSTFMKCLSNRLEPFGYRFVCLDTQVVNGRGEYSDICDRLNGVNYVVSPKSSLTLNLFELSTEVLEDTITHVEKETLNLTEKIIDVTNMLLSIIQINNELESKDSIFIKRLLADTVEFLYRQKGIIDGNPQSLYTSGSLFKDGKLTSGLVKKELPTISETYAKIYKDKLNNSNPNFDIAYDIVLASLKDYVKELNICPKCGEINCSCDVEKLNIKGVQPYYDGQSTISIDNSTPFVNIDISSLHESAKPVAIEVALNFILENFIKKNSQNVQKASRLMVFLDETHHCFKYPSAREFIGSGYRTARKYNVGIATLVQNVVDYEPYPDMQPIITNSCSKFILRQDLLANKFLLEKMLLTPAQVEKINSLDKGQMLIVDGNKKVFAQFDMLETEVLIADSNVENIRNRGGDVK